MDPEMLTSQQAAERLTQLGPVGAALGCWLHEDEQEESEVSWYEGNTTLEHLDVPDVVVVNGDLNIAGLLRDCTGCGASYLAVTRNVSAANLITAGRIIIGGKLEVAQLLYGNSLNDHWLEAKSICAHVIAEQGHSIGAGKVTARHCLQFMNTIKGADNVTDLRRSRNPELLASIFIDLVLSQTALDEDKLNEALRAGREVLC